MDIEILSNSGAKLTVTETVSKPSGWYIARLTIKRRRYYNFIYQQDPNHKIRSAINWFIIDGILPIRIKG